MPETLSQAEIDALLTATAPDEEPAHGLVPWSATVEGRVHQALGPLDGLPAAFAGRFATTLSRELARPCRVRLARTSASRYADLAGALPVPSRLSEVTVAAPGTGGTFLFVTSRSLAFSLVDAYFGGGATAPVPAGRERFTAVEERVVGKVTDLALAELNAVLAPIVPVSLSRSSDAGSPRFPGPIAAAEIVAVLEFEVTWDSVAAAFFLVVPESIANERSAK